jgi:hypothetical protein
VNDAQRDAAIAELRQEVAALREVRDYWLKPPAPGAKARAEEFEELRQGMSAGKLIGRAVLWLAGAVVAVAAAFQVMKGWRP